jgi:hypothetical protein
VQENKTSSLDLSSLKRLNMLQPGFSGSLHWLRNGERVGTIGVWVQQDWIKLSYRSRPYGGEWESIEDTIPLVETEAGFGGRRKWFLCASCGRRARILYGGRLYRCRICRGATYESQYEPFFHASHERIRRLKKRLGDRQADTWAPIPTRPKGMHRKTYERLCDEIWNEEMRMDRALTNYAVRRGYEF